MHDELHWLDVTDRVQFKLAVLMYRCLYGTAPPYLMDSLHSQQKSLAVNICVLPLSKSWSYRAIDWTVSAVSAILWRARRLGIRCQTVFVTQNWVSILSNVSWRHTFLWNI